MDPINHGSEILKILASEFDNNKITEQAEIKEFVRKLIGNTSGLVIIDFLDTTNWDMVESFEFDDEDGILTLIWHDFREDLQQNREREMSRHMFSASRYSLGIAVKSVVPIVTENTAVFLMNGYSRTQKQIRKRYGVGCSEFEISNRSFFEKTIIRTIDDKLEKIEFHCTPIYSIAILPKRNGMTSFDSRKILYEYNIGESADRVSTIIKALDSVDENDHDQICEKVNTARRVFEFILKIECCAREINIKGDYSKVLLGHLLNYVKPYKVDIYRPILGNMAEILNEFSHDSGKKVNLTQAKMVCMLVLAYILMTRQEVRDKLL